LKNAKKKKIKYVVEMGKNKMVDFWEGENKKNSNGGRKAKKIKYEITTGLMSRREHHILGP
jgi:hypothetical protein